MVFPEIFISSISPDFPSPSEKTELLFLRDTEKPSVHLLMAALQIKSPCPYPARDQKSSCNQFKEDIGRRLNNHGPLVVCKSQENYMSFGISLLSLIDCLSKDIGTHVVDRFYEHTDSSLFYQ